MPADSSSCRTYGPGPQGSATNCSGFTYSLYHALGKTIPRDATRQIAAGRWVSKSALRQGDLLFFKNSSGAITHVAMYYGLYKGVHLVIESPRTWLAVRLTPQSIWTWQYAGARRYV